MQIINIKSGAPYDVYCGRAGHGQDGYFGNPHKIGYCDICKKNHEREECLIEYTKDFSKRLQEDAEFKSKIEELKNKICGCFCHPHACHLDIIKKYLEFPKVIIAGSREITGYSVVNYFIRETLKENKFRIGQVVCGEARGVDTVGKDYAFRNLISVKSFPANWEKYGKSAGYRRNEEMAKYASHLILIWDGKSKGSGHMKDLAIKYKLQIYERIYDPTRKS